MFFTQEDYRKIVEYLRLNSYKDTDLPSIGEMNLLDEDIITIVHNGINYKVPLRKFIAAIGSSEDTVKTVHSINVSFITDEGESISRFVKYSTTEEAIAVVPIKYRFPGIGITWVDTNNVWKTYLFKGTSAEQWNDLSQFIPYNLANEIHENEGLNPGDSGYIEDSSEVGVTQRLLQLKVQELKSSQGTLETTLEQYTDTEIQTAKSSLLGNASEAGNTLGKLESIINNKSGIVKVAVLPEYSEAVLNKIYLVPNSEDPNIYDAFYYDSGWKQVGGVDPTISDMTQAEITAGTGTTGRKITPKILRDNFYTEDEVDTLLGSKANSNDLATVATSGSYNDLSNKPTNVSAFNNDAGYITIGDYYAN